VSGKRRQPSPSRVAKKWKKLPKGWTEESVEKFWDTLTGGTPEHKVWDCIDKMTKPFGDGAGAFCGGLADWQMPGWRQKNKKESPDARSDAKSYWKGKIKKRASAERVAEEWFSGARMASASAPVLKFLQRLRGKGKGALNINVLEEALPLLGWSITKTTAPLRIADPDSVKPLLEAMLNPSFIWGYSGTKEPKRVDFDSVEEAEAGLRKWQREAQKGKPPRHPTFKKFYYTQALYPVEERAGGSRFKTGYFFDIMGLWLGVEAYEVTNPSGASVLLPLKPDYRGRFKVDLLRWKMATFWTWAYKNGIQDDAAAYLDTIGAEEVARVTAPASARSLDGTGTCPACFNNVKLRRGERIMRHGWQVQGQRQWGSYGNTWHTGPCFGTGYVAFELSPDGTKDYRDQVVIPYKGSVENELARVKRGADPITVDKGRRWERTLQPGDPEYSRYQDISIKQGTKAVSDLEQDIRTLDSRITGWKEAPLPGARMASSVRVALRFAVRKAPPMQMGSATMLKKQGLTPVDVFFGEARPHNRPTLQLLDSVQDRKGDVYFFVGVAPDGSAILAETEGEAKRKHRKIIEDRKHYESRMADGSPLMLQPDYGTSNAALPREGARTKGKSLPETGYTLSVASIYRAVPAGVTTIEPMDYVTRTKKWAQGHADHVAAVEEDEAVVLKAMVKAADVYEASNPGEYFYDGPAVRGRVVYRQRYASVHKTARDFQLTELEITPGQEPASPDIDFATVITAEFLLDGKPLAKVLGVQQRTLERHLAKHSSRKLLHALFDSKEGERILTALQPKIKAILADHGAEQGQGHPHHLSIEWDAGSSINSAAARPGRGVHYTVEIDAHGEWSE